MFEFSKQGRINGLCPAALHSQLYDHMCRAGLILCVQGDFVMVHWGLVTHNHSLYLTKQGVGGGRIERKQCWPGYLP